jgi:hypothetical protein
MEWQSKKYLFSTPNSYSQNAKTLFLPSSKMGALIGIRDPSQLAMTTQDRKESFQLCISPAREVYSRVGSHRKRRMKACMKQVVGGVFTGLSEDAAELDIVDALVTESQRCVNDPMKPEGYYEAILKAGALRIVSKLRVLLGYRVTRYFDLIASKLFTIELGFNVRTNNCNQFCANILEFREFGSFLATTPTSRLHVPKNPLYLVSFTSPPDGYDSQRPVKPQSERSTPSSLTEEYLLRFRHYGHHDESDIIDTMLEYWYDWGAFGGPLYKYQNLFPWDCTEAFKIGDNSKCNNCSIAKHVWSFPFDAWSMVQLHLFKERSMYSLQHNSGKEILSDTEWMRNRLTTLSALKALNTVAVAMAKTLSFRATCYWNREQNKLTPETVLKLDRIKLSGIHRAQPHSHPFKKGKYHDCMGADWALLKREDQIREYERLRDHRVNEVSELDRLDRMVTEA